MIFNPDDSRILKFTIPMIAGAVSGCFAVLFTNPIDLAKTRLQLQGELQKKGQYNKQLNGIMDTLIKTVKNEGVLSLQKGLAPAFAFQIIQNGFRIGMYENLKKFTEKGVLPQHRLVLNMISSGTLGFIGAFFASPFNMIKTRIQQQSNFLDGGNRYHYTGSLNAINTIYDSDGVKGLFKGSKLWGFRTGMGSAVQLPAFDMSKIFVKEQMGINGMPGLMLASAFSSFLLCVVMCPLDGLATRYLSQTFDSQGQGLLYKNVYQGAKDILRIEGFQGFYKGFIPFLLKMSPQSFITLILYSKLMQSLQ